MSATMVLGYDASPSANAALERTIADATKSGAHVVAVPNSVGGTEQVKTYFDLIDTIVGAIAATKGG